jgi:hypothetical protein
MTTEMIFDIDSMPRGGPEAAPWLGLRWETGRLDYLYCNDVDLYCNDVDHLNRGVVRSPRMGL